MILIEVKLEILIYSSNMPLACETNLIGVVISSGFKNISKLRLLK